jgi:uncharacterized damage-inducible protein DinB
VTYDQVAIPDRFVPHAREPLFQHLVDTYASEINKTASTWRAFGDDDLSWRPHPKSSTVQETMRHQLLSEHRFFAEFLGSPEPPGAQILPSQSTVMAYSDRLVELAMARLGWIAAQDRVVWLSRVQFFDVERDRIWIFWRRVLHTAHHRTQLTVYLRLLNRTVLPSYGPTADVTWSSADPTLTVEAADRSGTRDAVD